MLLLWKRPLSVCFSSCALKMGTNHWEEVQTGSSCWVEGGWNMNQSSDNAGRAIKCPKSYCAMGSPTNLTPTKSPACWGRCPSWLQLPSQAFSLIPQLFFRIKASNLTGELQQFLYLYLQTLTINTARQTREMGTCIYIGFHFTNITAVHHRQK